MCEGRNSRERVVVMDTRQRTAEERARVDAVARGEAAREAGGVGSAPRCEARCSGVSRERTRRWLDDVEQFANLALRLRLGRHAAGRRVDEVQALVADVAERLLIDEAAAIAVRQLAQEDHLAGRDELAAGGRRPRLGVRGEDEGKVPVLADGLA